MREEIGDKDMALSNAFRDNVFLASVASNLPGLYHQLYEVVEFEPDEDFSIPRSEEDLKEMIGALRSVGVNLTAPSREF